MKTLYIVRHAKSSWDNPGIDDFDRPLNKRGLKDAPKMAKYFAENNPKPELIISSPARRALETAENFAESLSYKITRIQIEETIYEAGIEDLLIILHECEDIFKRVMLVGHNPSMTRLINFFSPVKIDNFPTCGVFTLSFDTKKWRKITLDNCEFKSFESPKKNKLLKK